MLYTTSTSQGDILTLEAHFLCMDLSIVNLLVACLLMWLPML
jgi:hypothetical protein